MAISANSKILASDVSGAVKSFTVSGKTVTYTTLGGATGTFTTQDTNTTYSNMTAATASAAGTAGLVPAPAAGAQAKFLRGDATWQTISSYSGTVSLKKSFDYNYDGITTYTVTVTSLTINKPIYLLLAPNTTKDGYANTISVQTATGVLPGGTYSYVDIGAAANRPYLHTLIPANTSCSFVIRVGNGSGNFSVYQ